jgi:hypothetical protein
MSKFNTKTQSAKTENLAGGRAYKLPDKMEFVTFLLTSFVNDQFYRSEETNIEEIKRMISGMKDKKFVAKSAIFARNEFRMRSITHIVAGEIAKQVKGENWTKNFFDKVVYRTDDITEILSYYLSNYKKPIPNSLRKGLKKAFDKFDAYQIAKYRGEGKEFKLIDAVNLLHPKGSEKNSDALAKLVRDELKSTTTWESKLTGAGQKAKNEEEKFMLKKEAWIEFVNNPKLEYFALIRNLRNIQENAPEAIDKACEELVNEKRIYKSMVLPFRFTTAYEEVNNAKIKKYLNKAVEISLSNVPRFKGKTLVVLDESGSMTGKPAQIGSLFAMALVKTNNCDFMTFNNDARYRTVNTDDTLITLANSVRFASGGTNFHSIFQKASKAYDRIIILSDMQGWMGGNTPQSEFNQYKKSYNCDPYIYSFDLQGYGTSQIIGNKIMTIAGFSENIFEIIAALEQDKNTLIKRIEEIEI